MLPAITATRFGRAAEHGRTRPPVLFCEQQGGGDEVEVYVKLLASRQLSPAALMCEGIAALLGRDLGLPIPEPFAVEVTDQFVSALGEDAGAEHLRGSVGWNFGSKAAYPQFAPWSPWRVMPIEMRATAAEVFAFDAMIQNPDRRHGNPNCKVRGSELLIYDHDLAFDFLNAVLSWKPPWEPDALEFLCGRSSDRHVFFDHLRGMPHAFERLVGAWGDIDAARLNAYVSALPAQWIPAGNATQRVLEYIASLKLHLPETILEVRKALH